MLVIPSLADQFEVHGTECYPTFARRISDGEWLLINERQTS
jgi:hypothetical protein